MEQVSKGVEFTAQVEGLPLSTGSANSTSKKEVRVGMDTGDR